jgi:16S rRNA (guanine527-N7)-methyltransferase
LSREPPGADAVARRLRAKKIAVSAAEAGKLAAFIELLLHWNRVHNLTGIRDRDELLDRHLVESLALKSLIEGETAADIGSGGGLPGIPLAIVLPDRRFTLIESRRKRASFLRHAAATLALDNVEVAHSRAEELGSRQFATVLARAVAPPPELLGIATPLVATGGRLVLLTGADKAREIVALAEGFMPLPAVAGPKGLKSVIVALERKLS